LIFFLFGGIGQDTVGRQQTGLRVVVEDKNMIATIAVWIPCLNEEEKTVNKVVVVGE
jgi:hypothetical protein